MAQPLNHSTNHRVSQTFKGSFKQANEHTSRNKTYPINLSLSNKSPLRLVNFLQIPIKKVRLDLDCFELLRQGCLIFGDLA